MYEYVKGKAMWANITTPNTRFKPHKYGLTGLTDDETATKLEGIGLSQVRTRAGESKYEEPAFTFNVVKAKGVDIPRINKIIFF